MDVRFDSSVASLFEVEEEIKPLVSMPKLQEWAMYQPTTNLIELTKVLRRDDAKILLPEVLDETIITKVEEAVVGRNLVDVVAISGDSFSWMEETGFEAEMIPEGSEIPIAHATWEKFYVSVEKYGIRPVITKEMVDDARWPVIVRNLEQASRAMARYEDATIFAALNAGIPNGVAVAAGVGGIGTVVPNHRISMGPNEANNPLTFRSIARGYTILRRENYTANTLLMHPYQMYELIHMEEFVPVSSPIFLALPENVRSTITGGGVIGTLMGMKVVVSASQTAGQVLMFDSDVFAILYERQGTLTEKYDDPIRQLHGICITARSMPAVVRRDAGVMLNQGRTAFLGI